MPNGNPQNINGYAIERTSIGNDDFFDIDWFDTSDSQYKTAKVRGSVLIALISNIYTSNGVLNGDRTIDADFNSLLIENLRKFQIDVNPAPFGATGVEFNVNPSGRLFSIKDSSTGERRFDVNQDGSVTFNQEFTFPLLDGGAGEVLATDGAGQLSWIPLPSSAGDMTKAQYDPNNDGIVESARKEMVAFINKTGATLTKGTIVFLKTSSVSATFPEVVKANASTEATSSKTIGAVFEDVPNDATGFIVTSGEVDNLDTSAFTIGQRLWLSTTDGQVTTTPPVQPNHSVFIGIVTRSQNVNGRVLYAIQNGYELDELHNVLISSASNGQVLTFDSVTQLWTNQTLPSAPTLFNQQIQDEGSNVTQRNIIDFVGAGVSVTDNGTKTIVTIPSVTTAFIPPVESTELKRGSSALSGTTTLLISGGLTITNTGSAVAVSFGGSTPYAKFRLLTTTGTTNSVVGLHSTSSGNVCRIAWGFRFVGSYIFTDESAGGTQWFVPNARQFMGLTGATTLLGISSTTSVESLTNVIGIGSDVGDTNLQVFHNDGSGLCTKIDLGSSFPANKTGAVANGKGIMLELFNAYGSTDVKYRVTNLADNVVVTGTISTNIPSALLTGMQGQVVRTSGSTSQNVSIDVMQCSWWTLT